MTVHLIKMCVGVERPEQLELYLEARWQAQRDAGIDLPEIIHRTRMFPKRQEEILDGGSLYWVAKGAICMRQAILDLRVAQEDGVSKCDIVLDRTIMLTKRRRKRPFQGWRYLSAEDAPPDRYPLSADDDDGSHALKAELAALGLI